MDGQKELELVIEKFNEAYLAWSEKHGHGANFKWIYTGKSKQLFLDSVSPLTKTDNELQGKAHAAAIALDAELKKVSPAEDVLAALKQLRMEDVSFVSSNDKEAVGVTLLSSTTITAVRGPVVFNITTTKVP